MRALALLSRSRWVRLPALTAIVVGLSFTASTGQEVDERPEAFRRAPAQDPPPPELQALDDDLLRPPMGPAPTDPRDGRSSQPPRIEEEAIPLARRALGLPTSSPEIGGDDVSVLQLDDLFSGVAMDIADNGDIYLGVGDEVTAGVDEIRIFRSTDGGDTFTLWGSIDHSGDTDRLNEIHVLEGNANRLYVLYQRSAPSGFSTDIAYADLSSTTPSWTERTVFEQSGVSYPWSSMDADDENFDTFFLYAVAGGIDGNGDDIWFTRSTDFGDTWSAPYRIAELTASGSLMYQFPEVRFGSGGVIHVGWTYTERLQDTFDDGVRYIRAVDFAASPSDWSDFQVALQPSDDGVDQTCREILASPEGPEVVALLSHSFGGDPQAFFNTEAGVNWALPDLVPLPLDARGTGVYVPSRDEFAILGLHAPEDDSPVEVALTRASITDLTSWSSPVHFSEHEPNQGGSAELAVDPSHQDRFAAAWRGFAEIRDGTDYDVFFDAEWRADVGYPNFEDGFPKPLPVASGRPTAPALADVDDDPDEEIVFGHTDGQVFVVDPDGSTLPGWPQDVGDTPYGSPVAVGDLNGNGEMVLAVGTTDGQVFAFDGEGGVRPGFPVDLGTNAETYVSIGAVGPPYHRWILAASGDRFARISYRGEVQFKSGFLVGTYSSPAAVGDLEGDGDTEVVLSFDASGGGSGLHVYNGDLQGGVQQYRGFTEEPNDAVTLADLDLDGSLEIAHPTAGGILYVVDAALADLPGFPFDNGAGNEVTSAAFHNIVGTAEPELVFGSQDWRVHVLFHDGGQGLGYPAETTVGWWLYGAPIMVRVRDTVPEDVVVGDRGRRLWAFTNVFADLPPGWPKSVDSVVEVSPAAGDPDRDGRNEIVFVSDANLLMVDVGAPPTVGPGWRMYAHDPQRTGCYECPEDLATSASPEDISRLAFRLDSANPSAGPVSFAVELPGPAVLELEVYDVRGRRVRTVTRRELTAGAHVLRFDGRDDDGDPLARGQYFARLSVRGSGLDTEQVRRFLLVDG